MMLLGDERTLVLAAQLERQFICPVSDSFWQQFRDALLPLLLKDIMQCKHFSHIKKLFALMIDF